jgi:hypothetical protein
VISDKSNKTKHDHTSNMVIGRWLPVSIDHRKKIIKNKHYCPLLRTILAIDDRPINLSSMILDEIFVNRNDTCDKC